MQRAKDAALRTLSLFVFLEAAFSFFSTASPETGFVASLLGATVGGIVWFGTAAMAEFLIGLRPTREE